MQKESGSTNSVTRIIKEIDPDFVRCHHNPDYFVLLEECNYNFNQDCSGPCCDTLEEAIQTKTDWDAVINIIRELDPDQVKCSECKEFKPKDELLTSVGFMSGMCLKCGIKTAEKLRSRNHKSN